MMKPHKWAKEIHAIADGIEVQWSTGYEPIVWYDLNEFNRLSPLDSGENVLWRIKPPEVAQWRKTMAQALEDGKVVEFETPNGWDVSIRKSRDFLDPAIRFDGKEYYRIRPEPRPDVVKYFKLESHPLVGIRFSDATGSYAKDGEQFIKVAFDGTTGKPISAEVL